ncbi:MAG: C_GCAxxG_C_C family protein [Acidimicrobiales bacterium]|nr:C_GCAxxG_C_C family protein [Acidimicrobiales bacterium]
MSLESFPVLSTPELRRRSLSNLLRMGHCAPTVMQTILDASDAESTWLVTLTAGLPGGIGNTGGECGGLTAPLVLLGLRSGRNDVADGLPVVVDQGHDMLRRFTSAHGTTECRAIRGDSRLPLACIGVVRQSPELCARSLAVSGIEGIPPETRQAFRELYLHWVDQGFHCADAVFEQLGRTIPIPAEAPDAVTAFMGGTLFTGRTCGALTAGVMALGLAVGQIEGSRIRVLRMIATMAVGGNAFADDMNAFNRVMNLGHELARWFEVEFGSTQCRALTGCDFATTDGVRDYVEGDGVSACAAMARRVSSRVAEMLADEPPRPQSATSGSAPPPGS